MEGGADLELRRKIITRIRGQPGQQRGMIGHQGREQGGGEIEVGGKPILHLCGGIAERGPGDGGRRVIGLRGDIVNKTGQGTGEIAEVRANRSLNAVRGRGAVVIQLDRNARGVLHHHAARTAAIHVGAVGGAQQKQPRRRFPVERAIAVARLAAVDDDQVEITAILRQPEGRARIDLMGESELPM